MVNKYLNFVNEEVGVRKLKSIVKDAKDFEIYFHKDLDGVCSALCMKYFLSTYYNLSLVDCHIIQYGGLEFAVKNGLPNTLKVLVDFAHSKPMYSMSFDHHQTQVGGDDTESTYFKPARSNAETISGEISYSDAFTPQDIELIKTIDSADFLKYNLSPDDVQNSIFKYKRELSGDKNRFLMGFVTNRLLLAYKNKRITVKSLDGKTTHVNKNILECLVMDSNPSLYSIFNNIRHYINNARVSDKLGVLAKPEDLMRNLSEYIENMKKYKFVEVKEGEAEEYDPNNWKHKSIVNSGSKISKGVHFDEKYKIISQYGGGSMFKPGSYDRYVPFKNNPDANFICIVWPMGLIQVSCNPFIEKKLKNIDLGEISKEVMLNYKSSFENIYVSLESIKNEFENSQDWKKMKKDEGPEYEGVGFKYSDLKAFYNDCVYKKEGDSYVKIELDEFPEIKSTMNVIHEKMNGDLRSILNKYKIPVWELIVRNSGGHPSITNIQGFAFLKYDKNLLEKYFKTIKYTDVMKTVAREFINNLKSKIDMSESGKSIDYTSPGFEFKGQDANENYEYFLVNSTGNSDQVSKEIFVKAGSKKGMRPDKKSGLTIDPVNKRIIAKFEDFSS